MSTFTIDRYWSGFFKTLVGRSIVHVDSNTLLGGIHVALEKFSLGWSFVDFGTQAWHEIRPLAVCALEDEIGTLLRQQQESLSCGITFW